MRNLELCCECSAPTGRAGHGDDSLYAGDHGPYCEDCWGIVPEELAARVSRLERVNTRATSEADAMRAALKHLYHFMSEIEAGDASTFEAQDAITDALRAECGILRTEKHADAEAIGALREALRDVIGLLDDPTGGEHVRDMRGAQIIATAVLKATS